MKTKHVILLVAFLGMFSNIQAQDATLEETLEFIKLKSANRILVRWYDDTYDGKDIQLMGKKIYVKTIEKFNYTIKLYIDLTKIRIIEIYNDTYIKITPDEVIYYTLLSKKDGKMTEDYQWLGDYGGIIDYGADAPRVLKAYKHLLDLLGIKLMEEKF